jgi:hypothetical protein
VARGPEKYQKPGLPRYRKDRNSGQRPFDLIPVKHPRSYAIDAKDVSLVLLCSRRPGHKPAGRQRLLIAQSWTGAACRPRWGARR